MYWHTNPTNPRISQRWATPHATVFSTRNGSTFWLRRPPPPTNPCHRPHFYPWRVAITRIWIWPRMASRWSTSPPCTRWPSTHSRTTPWSIQTARSKTMSLSSRRLCLYISRHRRPAKRKQTKTNRLKRRDLSSRIARPQIPWPHLIRVVAAWQWAHFSQIRWAPAVAGFSTDFSRITIRVRVWWTSRSSRLSAITRTAIRARPIPIRWRPRPSRIITIRHGKSTTRARFRRNRGQICLWARVDAIVYRQVCSQICECFRANSIFEKFHRGPFV